MHIAVSWDITDGPDRSAISDKLVAILKPFSWFRPLTTYYIIKADTVGRQSIIDGLNSVSKAHPNRVRFVVTPLMQGRYQGLLKTDEWTQINERTD